VLGEFPTVAANRASFNSPITTFPSPTAPEQDDVYLVALTPTNEVAVRRYDGFEGTWSAPSVVTTNYPDIHTTPGLAVDQSGVVHVWTNMHSTPWQYWRAQAPSSVAAWTFLGQPAGPNPNKSTPGNAGCTGQCQVDWTTDEPGIAALPGNQITYPQRTYTADGSIVLSFRECVQCSASYHDRRWSTGMARYDVQAQTWRRLGPRPFAQGHNQALGDADHYRSNQLFVYGDATGRLHAYHFRCLQYSEEQGGQHCYANPNAYVYVASDDGGLSWRDAQGVPVLLPLTYQQEPVAISSQLFAGSSDSDARYWQTGWITANWAHQPWIVAVINNGNYAGAPRHHYTVDKGAWITPGRILPYAASQVIGSPNPKIWLALSSGMRLFRSQDGGVTWTLLLEELTTPGQIASTIPWDHRAWHRRRLLYLYAQYAADGGERVRVYRVRFGR
jgi:hypothetical protein